MLLLLVAAPLGQDAIWQAVVNLLGTAEGQETIKFTAIMFVSLFVERGCRVWKTVDISEKQSL